MSGRGDDDEPEYRELAEFRHRIRRFLRFSEQAVRAAGLAPRQHQLLLAVKGAAAGEAPTIGALAGRLGIRHHSAVGLVDRLASRRLVRRRRDGRDRRQVHVELTPPGEDLLRRLSLHHRAELRTEGPALVRALRAIIGPSR
jgi:DNA-binding MarR family transcriptional regulator